MADLNLSASPSGGKNPKTPAPKGTASKETPKLRMSPTGDHSPVSRTAGAIVGVVSVVALALAVFLSSPSATTAQEGATVPGASSVTATGHTTRVAVGVEGMSFTPNHIEVPVGDRLIVDFTNSGDQRHDLVFESGVTSGSLATGETKELDLGIVSGDMEGWCSLPGHRQAGMTIHVQAVGVGDAVELVGQVGDVAVEDRGVDGRHRDAPHDALVWLVSQLVRRSRAQNMASVPSRWGQSWSASRSDPAGG